MGKAIKKAATQIDVIIIPDVFFDADVIGTNIALYLGKFWYLKWLSIKKSIKISRLNFSQ